MMFSEKINIAYRMALDWHGNQKYGEQPYMYHLRAVAEICKPYGEDYAVVAYLHDILEDTDLDARAILVAFGYRIFQNVVALTDPTGATRADRKAKFYELFKELRGNPEYDLAFVVKAADRLANVRACVAGNNRSLLEMYRSEHVAFCEAVRDDGLNYALIDELTTMLTRAT